MDVGLKPIPSVTFSIPNESVSILVLMDVGLKPLQVAGYIVTASGFNPCFDGCWS